ncbi:hypothetical protein GKO32_02640, partial [Amycolatopsis sp. RM579]|nr:hypothetical protein [Amycolatopsis pithecellobii]
MRRQPLPARRTLPTVRAPSSTHPAPGIRDVARVNQLFATLRPELVFHAAAHKHLPLLERHPCEGVKSN